MGINPKMRFLGIPTACWSHWNKSRCLINSGKHAASTLSASKTSNEVSVEFDALTKGLAIIGMNRPEAKNAFSANFVSAFNDALDRVSASTSTRVVILRSLVPRVFCAGADLKERLTMKPSEVGIFVSRLRAFTTRLETLPVPVIAAIDGAALGGGLEMALACDIRIASDSAKIGLVETKLAIIPGAGGTQRLARIVGPAIAKELIFTGRILDGIQAHQLGVVNHVVNQNDNYDAAFTKAAKLAEEIASNGPIALKLAKTAIDKGLQVDINVGYSIEEACYAQLLHSKDRLEGLNAFVEKRAPKYKGE
ncbi:methylglutaconyl-CoA hydratase, mitochondrial [Ischnura elegans]|uniref:methylglutaconyl-CoA hydratase, mitochondrial n=1 Tax=Ischnura elegans TaxID=197161 RepID=UPI001ED894B6|nr:methylglutaconyl-CoA hydratase, mitochondrial [Ischnura elegans]